VLQDDKTRRPRRAANWRIVVINDGTAENKEREKEGMRNGQVGAVNANDDKIYKI